MSPGYRLTRGAPRESLRSPFLCSASLAIAIPVATTVVDDLRARVAALEADKDDLRRRLDHADERHAKDIDRLQQLLAAAISSTCQLAPASSEETRSDAPTLAQTGGVDRLSTEARQANAAPGRLGWRRFWRWLAPAT